MKCPHCGVVFHDNQQGQKVLYALQYIAAHVQTSKCPACTRWIIKMKFPGSDDYTQVFPVGSTRGPVPPEVPKHIAGDYVEAVRVLPFSPKASAALSRRCLQAVLHDMDYKDRDLAREIDLVMNESDPKKAIPHSLREVIDAVRNFGNFSAHPINEVTTLQIIEVEPHEAEWCLEVVEEAFAHFYIRPAQARARKAALNAKLASANKPPAK